MCFGLNEGIVCNIDNRNLPQCLGVVFSKLIAHPTEMKLMIFTRYKKKKLYGAVSYDMDIKSKNFK
ncbi:hypothetical protein HID58_020499 [Brassica napus]|uniref:Uncharacterized protein n=1 Tax=Brassica napus TaxID=3708 RepID=A0ABQ7XIN4_BRANA|nr:hypothetical protein HID58_020499 [Brassica napus]